MRVDIETIVGMQKWRDRINRANLEDIEFFENGKRLCMKTGAVEKFGYTGLNNLDFITSGAYKGQ